MKVATIHLPGPTFKSLDMGRRHVNSADINLSTIVCKVSFPYSDHKAFLLDYVSTTTKHRQRKIILRMSVRLLDGIDINATNISLVANKLIQQCGNQKNKTNRGQFNYVRN